MKHQLGPSIAVQDYGRPRLRSSASNMSTSPLMHTRAESGSTRHDPLTMADHCLLREYTSQAFTVPESSPAASSLPFGEKANVRTPSAHEMVPFGSPVTASQNRT